MRGAGHFPVCQLSSQPLWSGQRTGQLGPGSGGQDTSARDVAKHCDNDNVVGQSDLKTKLNYQGGGRVKFLMNL